MTAGRKITVPLLGLLLLTPLFAARPQAAGKAPAAKPAPQKQQAPPRPQQRQPGVNAQANAARKAAGGDQNNQAGVQTLQRLSKMTPEERQQALASLPPQRRQEIL